MDEVSRRIKTLPECPLTKDNPERHLEVVICNFPALQDVVGLTGKEFMWRVKCSVESVWFCFRWTISGEMGRCKKILGASDFKACVGCVFECTGRWTGRCFSKHVNDSIQRVRLAEGSDAA